MSTMAHHHYNPGWLSDDALVANFVARQDEFSFLRDELARAPREGTVQHYLLVGVRGAGKTTLLKRLAVAIRRDSDMRDHLIALSFPEELYQVKNLADFWWAACDALADELDSMRLSSEADQLAANVELARRHTLERPAPASDAGFKLLQQTCAQLKLRPVLLVDNLDMVFQRIDKSGRKLNDPHAPAYWALREALSTATAPIVIGGSVRLSAPFTDYDRAFYDFFLPKRLGKLSLDEVREVLDRLADAQGLPKTKQRLRARPGRIEALFELTGGNPRALGLMFELLRNGPNSRSIEDFERLMDITTPYYKARIEDLSEQAQVIMQGLAVQSVAGGDGLRFGHTAADIGTHTGLPTSTVSAQLTILENEGLVEKSAAHGRTQYRIAEQLFRLWLQMRGTRRIRQNVIGLARFFEAMYEPAELQLMEPCGASPLAEAKFAFAVACTNHATPSQRADLETFGIHQLRLHLAHHDGKLDDYLPDTLPVHIVPDDADPQEHQPTVKILIEQGYLASANNDFVAAEAAFRKAVEIAPTNGLPWICLGSFFADHLKRADDAENAYRKAIELDPTDALPWTSLARLMAADLERHNAAEAAYRHAIALDPTNASTWSDLGSLLDKTPHRHDEAEAAYRQTIELDPTNAWAWTSLGNRLADKQNCIDDAETTLRHATMMDPSSSYSWFSLGCLLGGKLQRYDEAEDAFRRSITCDPSCPRGWRVLGSVLEHLQRNEEALDAYEQSIALDPNPDPYWRARHTKLRMEICIANTRKALATGDHPALHIALARMLGDPDSTAAVMASGEFVERLLAPILWDTQAATAILNAMRSLGYERYARPLLLAFEAALTERSNMLTELEPEIQGAAIRMFERLSAAAPKKKKTH